MKVVVDTNIVFCALASGGASLGIRLTSPSENRYYAPRFLFIELFKHKERLIRATRLSENNLLEALNTVIESLHFIDSSSIPMGIWMESRRLCEGVDLKDTPFVAMTLYLEGLLWTEDIELKTGLRAKGFNQFFNP